MAQVNFSMMHVPKRSVRQQYRQKQREQVDASPLLAKKFPHLKALKVVLEYFDATGHVRNGELKCQLNVAHAHSALWFACPGAECAEGDFDLSRALAQAIAGRRKVATGELRCAGTRQRAGERVACQTLLRYKLILNYD